MPVCSRCGKESKNLRVCPFCHSEYTADDIAGRTKPPRASRATPTPFRGTAAVPAPGAPGRPTIRRQQAISPVTKIGLPIVIVAFAAWYFLLTGEKKLPTGVVLPYIIAAPMTPTEAQGLLARMTQSAKIETRDGAIAVTFPAAMWPERHDGQLALAQQYARADSLVNGSRRAISFYDPSGNLYAKADAAGVVLTR